MIDKDCPLDRLRILYVENDPLDILALRRAFSALGVRPTVEVTDSAERALDKLAEAEESSLPDALIVDLRMPGIGGLAFLETTKAHAAWRQIPSIVFSTSDLSDDRAAAKAAGAAAYVVKKMDNGVYAQLLVELERVTGLAS